MASAPKRKMTAAEYLAFERNSKSRHLYWDGEVFGMAGASRHHVKICGNIHRHIHVAFDDTGCEVMQSDMRVKNHRTGNYNYPDVVATCESPKFDDEHSDTLLNPQVVIEVLSKSTESFDRGDKFSDYQRLEALKEYVLVSQNKMRVERFTRSDESTWEYWVASDPEAVLRLATIDVEIALKDIYAKVDLDDIDEDEKDDDDWLKVVESKVSYELPG